MTRLFQPVYRRTGIQVRPSAEVYREMELRRTRSTPRQRRADTLLGWGLLGGVVLFVGLCLASIRLLFDMIDRAIRSIGDS